MYDCGTPWTFLLPFFAILVAGQGREGNVFIMPPPFSMWWWWGGGGGGGRHIVSPLSARTSVPSVGPVRNTIGFRAISFERIGVLD